MYVNYSTIVAQSLDYCSMIIEFYDKFKKTSKWKVLDAISCMQCNEFNAMDAVKQTQMCNKCNVMIAKYGLWCIECNEKKTI